MPQTPHVRMLNAAAREALEPLGLQPTNRPRLWCDDHGWWLVLVEFQASPFDKGSYLNVGAMWLWLERDQFTFDLGYRVGDFVAFRNKSQFDRDLARLVERAGEKIQKYRGRFGAIAAAAEQLRREANGRNCEILLHACVATALAGRHDDAHRMLDGLLQEPAKRGEVPLQAHARALAAAIADPCNFRLTVEDAVLRTRAALRLPKSGRIAFADSF